VVAARALFDSVHGTRRRALQRAQPIEQDMTVKFIGFLVFVYVTGMTIQVVLSADTPPVAPSCKSDWHEMHVL
jgi:hypothetical protein